MNFPVVNIEQTYRANIFYIEHLNFTGKQLVHKIKLVKREIRELQIPEMPHTGQKIFFFIISKISEFSWLGCFSFLPKLFPEHPSRGSGWPDQPGVNAFPDFWSSILSPASAWTTESSGIDPTKLSIFRFSDFCC